MKNINLKTRYRFKIELSLFLALVFTITLFYLYPRFEQRFGINKPRLEPDFIVTDIPRTIQLLKKLKPPPPEIPAKFEEIEFVDDVEITKIENIDSLNVVDSSEFVFQYYKQLLPYLDLEKFDPNVLEIQPEPLDQYHEYLNNRLTQIFKDKKSYKSRSHVDDVLAQSMGREPGMLKIDIGSVVNATNNYFKSNNKRNISVENIIKSEKHWYILELLWQKKGQTIFEIYTEESVRKINSVATLKESMNNLKENGLVFEVEGFERSRYFPAHNPDEMIEIVKRLLAQDLPTQQKDILSSFINFIIFNS
jgi:predicted transcriptional regulator